MKRYHNKFCLSLPLPPSELRDFSNEIFITFPLVYWKRYIQLAGMISWQMFQLLALEFQMRFKWKMLRWEIKENDKSILGMLAILQSTRASNTNIIRKLFNDIEARNNPERESMTLASKANWISSKFRVKRLTTKQRLTLDT